jgi:hypothetical protein
MVNKTATIVLELGENPSSANASVFPESGKNPVYRVRSRKKLSQPWG